MTSPLNNLVLDSFGLPDTFPPEWVPDRARKFINDTRKGMPAAELLSLASQSGFRPLWKPLPHMIEPDVLGLGLDVDGLQVSLLAKMTRQAGAAPAAPGSGPDLAVDPRQMALF